jgi:dienelactone hydrolase
VDGNKTVVGLGKTENRQYAKELAQRGYVTLAPAYPLLADFQPDLAALGYVSGTMKGIWDNIRGLDLLESMAFVHRSSLGAIGHSLGGHNAVFTAVFDHRIKAVVSSCGLDSFTDYKNGDITGWTSPRYMPGLAAYKGHSSDVPFDFDELLAALAPRPVLLSAPLHDGNFVAASVDRIATAARAVYTLLGAPEALVVEHPDCDHDFPEAMRQKAYDFLAQALKTAAQAEG